NDLFLLPEEGVGARQGAANGDPQAQGEKDGGQGKNMITQVYNHQALPLLTILKIFYPENTFSILKRFLLANKDPDPEPQKAQPAAARPRVGQRKKGQQRDDSGQADQPNLPGFNGVPVQEAYTPGIHQDGTHLQPDQKGTGHPFPAFLQKIDHIGMGAHRHNEAGLFFVSQEQGNILAGPGGGKNRDRKSVV